MNASTFLTDWKYSGTLSRQGGGPEEYNEIFNFNIYKDEIVINDLWKKSYTTKSVT